MTVILGNNAHVNNACNAYHNAGKDVDGVVNNIKRFGDKWVGVRAEFVKAAVSSVAATVNAVVSAVLNTLWALTLGITDSDARRAAFDSWKGVLNGAVNVVKSAVGVVCPFVVDKVFCERTSVASV